MFLKNIVDGLKYIGISIWTLFTLADINKRLKVVEEGINKIAKDQERADNQKPLEPPMMQELFEHQDLLWIKGIDVPYCLQCYQAGKKLKPMHRLMTRRGKGDLQYDARLLRCSECGKKTADIPSPFDHPKPD